MGPDVVSGDKPAEGVAPGGLSPDGFYYWTGQSWLSVGSPDGRWRWGGRTWLHAAVPSSSPHEIWSRRIGRVMQILLALWILTVALELFLVDVYYELDLALGSHDFTFRWGIASSVVAAAIAICCACRLPLVARTAAGRFDSSVQMRLWLGIWALLFVVSVITDISLAERAGGAPFGMPETRWQVLVSAGFGVAAALAAIRLVSFVMRTKNDG